jgi:hypothetical protein
LQVVGEEELGSDTLKQSNKCYAAAGQGGSSSDAAAFDEVRTQKP